MKLNRISDVNANTYQNAFDDNNIRVFSTRSGFDTQATQPGAFANWNTLTNRNCAFGKSGLASQSLTLSEACEQNTMGRLSNTDYSSKEFCFLEDYDKIPVSDAPLDYGQDSCSFQIFDKEQNPFQNRLKSDDKTGVLSFLLSSAVSANTAVDCVSVVLRAIKTKDRTTYGHSLRVARYAGRIASALNLDVLNRKKVKLTALLHDAGKLGIDDAILMKPGILSDEQWNEMKGHSDIGANIVRMLPKLTSISHYIRFHHERYDGNGYPNRLFKRDIPIVSRIIAVADAYDAMTQKRPYRSPLSKRRALTELEKQKEKQFDPDIVRIFVTLLRHRSSRKQGKKRLPLLGSFQY